MIRKFEKDYDLVSQQSSLDSALAYLKRLSVVNRVKSPHYPSSFLVDMQLLIDAKKNWDCLGPLLKLKSAYERITFFTKEVYGVVTELSRRTQTKLDTVVSLKLDCSDAFPKDDGSDNSFLKHYWKDDRKLIAKYYRLSEESQLIKHNSNLHLFLYSIVSGPGRFYESIACLTTEDQIIRTSIREKRQYKSIQFLELFLNRLQPLMKASLVLLLQIMSHHVDWIQTVFTAPAENAATQYRFFDCVRNLFMDGAKEVTESLRAYDLSQTAFDLVEEIGQKWDALFAGFVSKTKVAINPIKELINPDGSDGYQKKYKSRVLPDAVKDVKGLPAAFRGTCALEDRFVFFTFSGDGVQMQKKSKTHNSWYFCSFCLSTVPCLQGTNKEVFFSFILPENPPSLLYCAEPVQLKDDYQMKVMANAVKNTTACLEKADMLLALYANGVYSREQFIRELISRLRMTYNEYLKRPNVITTRSKNSRIYSSDTPVEMCDESKIPDEKNKSKKLQTSANCYVHQLLNIVLTESREEGDNGFVVAYGNKLLHIRYAIVGGRADTPAADEMLDSSGLCTSNSPCRVCNLKRSYFDKNLVAVQPGINNTQWRGREVMRGFFSALSQRPMNCELRWINHLAFSMYRDGVGMQRGPGEAVSVLVREVKSITRKELGSAFIDKLRVVEDYVALHPSRNPPYHGPCLSYLPAFKYQPECKKPTNLLFSNGMVDIATALGFPPCDCVCLDMMHAVGNMVLQFFKLLFDSEKTDKGKKAEYVRESMESLAREGMRVQGYGTDSFWYLPDSVISDARATMVSLGIDADSELLKALESNEKIADCKTNGLHTLAFSYFPVIFLKHRHIPVVRCMTGILVLCQRIYNSLRCASELEVYQLHLDLLINEFEALAPPYELNGSLHPFSHMDKMVFIFGPLRNMTCWKTEGLYYGSKKKYENTGNPSLTLFLKEISTIPAKLSLNREGIITMTGEIGSSILLDDIALVRVEEVQYRSLLNYTADLKFLANGLFRQITIYDIEKCSTISEFCGRARVRNGGRDYELLKGNPLSCSVISDGHMRTISCFEDLSMYANESGIQLLSSSNYKRKKYRKTCTCNKTSFSTISCRLKDLSIKDMCDNSKCFALVLDYNETVHLYALCAFFKTKIFGHSYEQVWAYEVPSISACCDADTLSCRLVDVSSPDMKRTPFVELLSVRRCIGDLRIRRLNETTVVVITEETELSQMKSYIPLKDY